MKATVPNVRWQRTPIRGEAAWIPRDLTDLENLRQRLTEAGHPSATVNGLTGWLVAKALGEVDNTSSKTRASYRRILAELGPAPTGDDDPKRSHGPHRAPGQPPIMHVQPRRRYDALVSLDAAA